jgi:hypothetical protein
MFEDYTVKQLLALGSLFAEMSTQDDKAETQADALLILRRINEELTIRGHAKPA